MPTLINNMPAHYEMLVSHSPPVFSHSPPAGFLSDFNAHYKLYEPLRTSCRPQAFTPLQSKKQIALTIQMPLSPKRSCLVIRLDGELSPETPDFQQPQFNKTKKKVVFADDQGLQLTQVRIMKEPSNVPPLWSLQFLERVTQGLISPRMPEQWTVDFRQPASDYLDFRRRLESIKVSLENVIVKENESMVVGTIKVKNMSFNKEVIVRASWDNWKTQEDIFCTYSQVGGTSGAYVLYDTFCFKITLPPASRKLEFCVCYRCDTEEFWDNNEGKNYSLSKRNNCSTPEEDLIRKLEEKNAKNISKPVEIPQIMQTKNTSWSAFSSYNQVQNTCPYW